MPPERDSVDVSLRADIRRVRRNRGWLALASLPWLGALGCVAAAIATGSPRPLVTVGHFLIFGAIALLFAYRKNANPRYESGKLSVTERSLMWGERELVARNQLTGGLLVPHKGRVRVSLERRLRPNILLEVESEEEGRALLRALELDASQTVAEVRGMSAVFSLKAWQQLLIPLLPVLTMFVTVPVLGFFMATAMPWGVAAGTMLLPFAIGSLVIPSKITIGADGILTRWLRWRSYFPFSEVSQVGPVDQRVLNKVYRGVQVTMRDGTSKFLPITQRGWGDEGYDAVIERIREAVELFRSGNVGTNASVLARNGRAPREWVTALRRVGEGANADMRTAPIASEQLLRVVEDLGASATARASAAVALSARGSDADRTRIRVAAEATAAPKLRIALEKAVSDADEEELASALSELEAHEAS
ncbi:MAG: hypothetical protein JNK04_14210 [Myxococcales bacterium]|nr:hypothetical protein [Myxococcales bacterium]